PRVWRPRSAARSRRRNRQVIGELISGRLTGDKVVVLVHRVAKRIADIGPDYHRITAGSCLCFEQNIKFAIVRPRHCDDLRHHDRPGGTGESRNLVWGKSQRAHELLKGYTNVVDY